LTISWEGDLNYYQRQYEQAIAQHQRVLEINPDFADAHQSLADDYFAKGMCQKSMEESGAYMRVMGYPNMEVHAREIYAKSGCAGFLQGRIEVENDSSNMEFYFPYQVAQDYARLNDKEKALSWLERCYNEQVGMNFVKIDPAFDNLHSEPRFVDLVKRMGFPNWLRNRFNIDILSIP
jgi:tetratricopeptide (TPR) repeat protein